MKHNLSSSAFPYVESKHLAVNGEKLVHGLFRLNLSMVGKGLSKKGAEKVKFMVFRQM